MCNIGSVSVGSVCTLKYEQTFFDAMRVVLPFSRGNNYVWIFFLEVINLNDVFDNLEIIVPIKKFKFVLEIINNVSPLFLIISFSLG